MVAEHNLRGKAAIITGGSTDTAAVTALALSSEGVSVCLCGPQLDLLEMAAARVRAEGGICETILSELNSPESASMVLEHTLSVFGRLDMLILVSPFWAGGQIHAHSVKAWDLVMEANLRQPFLMARTVLPHFRAQQSGEIMAIGSDSALGIYPQDGAYGVAMHALTTLMELIRAENAEYGIRTNILSPGVALTVDTDSEGRPALTSAHIAEWVIWLISRPNQLRGAGPILI